jgi:hypothetical protein
LKLLACWVGDAICLKSIKGVTFNKKCVPMILWHGQTMWNYKIMKVIFKSIAYFHQHNPNWLDEWINLNLNCSKLSLLFKQFNNPLQGQWNPHSHVNFVCFCAFDQCKAFMLEAYDCYLTQKDPIG